MAKILTIDDEAQVMTLIQFVLEGDGHSVVMGDSDAPVSEQVGLHKPDLLISDCLSGTPKGCIDMILDVRRLEHGHMMPILLCTSQAPFELDPALETLGDGRTSVVYKPFDIGELRAMTRLALGESRPRESPPPSK